MGTLKVLTDAMRRKLALLVAPLALSLLLAPAAGAATPEATASSSEASVSALAATNVASQAVTPSISWYQCWWWRQYSPSKYEKYCM